MAKSKRRNGVRSREKGAAHEREVANLLKAVYPEARRGIGQARSASEVSDVDGVPWWVECKHRKRVNVRGAYRQAVAARAACARAATTGPVLVVARDNAECDLAVLELGVFVRLLRELEQLRAAFDREVEA